jgi:hypothetical protein
MPGSRSLFGHSVSSLRLHRKKTGEFMILHQPKRSKGMSGRLFHDPQTFAEYDRSDWHWWCKIGVYIEG